MLADFWTAKLSIWEVSKNVVTNHKFFIQSVERGQGRREAWSFLGSLNLKLVSFLGMRYYTSLQKIVEMLLPYMLSDVWLAMFSLLTLPWNNEYIKIINPKKSMEKFRLVVNYGIRSFDRCDCG